MNAFLQSVIETKTPFGTAAVWWLGQMGLLIKIGETVLCADYFASDREDRQIPPPIPAAEMRGISAFLGSHDHLDHIDHEAWQIWADVCPKAVFVFPAMHQKAVLKDGIAPERCLGLNDGTSCRIQDVTVHAVAAAHEFLNQDPETGLYPCLQYIIEGNGLRIYHAGDTLRYEGMLGKLQSFGPIDLALLPINGRDAQRLKRDCIGNMTFQEAADLAGELNVRAALPGHWDMFAGNSADPGAFTEYLDFKYGGRVKTMVPEYLRPILLPVR